MRLIGLRFTDDRARCRFIIYRSSGSVHKRTSIRYGKTLPKSAALALASNMAAKLAKCPASKLAEFNFKRR